MKIYGQFDFINISVYIYDTSPQLYILYISYMNICNILKYNIYIFYKTSDMITLMHTKYHMMI